MLNVPAWREMGRILRGCIEAPPLKKRDEFGRANGQTKRLLSAIGICASPAILILPLIKSSMGF